MRLRLKLDGLGLLVNTPGLQRLLTHPRQQSPQLQNIADGMRSFILESKILRLSYPCTVSESTQDGGSE